ncbi:uncharacterized protein EI90DRAFT_3037344 [Cantharellus anzutake]|uniref:uncharacterized protein n=1 Tax=Cantharellus anzutake TaxID=1750568 RepID=UPI001903DCFD|nr:uncharacterized protein EI90DRAFT_3037344 [Cantharellus anzutake]KAF8339644.1 hypothetical protein EI90DRAFT_3037344 [Cantharellus anzutake]
MPLAFPAPALFWRESDNAEEEVYSPSPAPPVSPTLVIDPAILNAYDETHGAEQYSYLPNSRQAVTNGNFDPSSTEAPDNYFPENSNYHPESLQPHHLDIYHRDGPQGPPPEPIFEPEEPPFEDPPRPPPPKRPKRVKRPKRELECGFCQGDDERNKFGKPESMLSCAKCGRSGHPTCVDIKPHSARIARDYPWTCMECKPCEICQQKGDDTKLLFCDNCDRGWHYDCLDPPFDNTPEGDWNCPLCPPIVLSEYSESSRSGGSPEAEADEEALEEEPTDETLSIATPARRRGRITKARPRKAKFSLRRSKSSRSVRKPRPKFNGTLVHSTRGEKLTLKLRLQIREEQVPSSPFESFLKEEDLDTSKTSITNDDKNKFERSRIAAELRLAPPPLPLPFDTPLGPAHNSIRPLRSLTQLLVPSTPRLEQTGSPVPGPSTPLPSTPGGISLEPPPLRIRILRFGKFDIDTWYDAPFPEEYNNIPEGRLWMCEFCLKYMKSAFGFVRHLRKCKARHPPGDEIYRDGNISVFEVDGRKNKIYCQNLCLLSKMFLDHKSLFYDVEPFLFYVMTEADDGGTRFVGYFSKEKRSPKDYNVSCIMTLPVRQRKGWGNLLIDFSFLLSKKEGRAGSPEKPLSALGALSYRNYWTLAIMRYLQNAPDHVTIDSISIATAIKPEDVLATLQDRHMIHISDRNSTPTPKTPFSRHRRPRPLTLPRRNSHRKTATKEEVVTDSRIPNSYNIRWDRDTVRGYLEKWNAKGYLTLKPENLKWTPYLLSRAAKFDVPIQPLQPMSGVSNLKPSSPATASLPGDESLSAVEQAKDPNLTPEAGPSRFNAARSPKPASADIHGEEEDDDFREIEETPSRGLRIRSHPQQRLLRSIKLRHSSLRSASLPGEPRRRTRSQGMLREEGPGGTPIRNGRGRRRSREASIESVVKMQTPPRKRRRIQTSPESSILSSPPTRHGSPPLSDGENKPSHQRKRPSHRLGRTTAKLFTNENGHFEELSFTPMNGKRTSLRLNGASKNPPFTPLLDDPEAALRRHHKHRGKNPSDDLSPNNTELAPKRTNGEDHDQYEHSSAGETSPGALLTNGHRANVKMDNDNSDADGEGEEEMDTIRFDLGDEDAEGEDDIDAEGEPE